MTLVVAHLGWVDYDFGHSSVSLVLLGQMEIWQSRLVNRARWRDIKNQRQPNQGPGPSVTLYATLYRIIYCQSVTRSQIKDMLKLPGSGIRSFIIISGLWLVIPECFAIFVSFISSEIY